MSQRIPVDVVVDTWNLRKQACKVLGDNRFPEGAGVVNALADQGFDVRHVYAAVACEPYSDNPSAKVTKALAGTTRYFTDAFARFGSGTLLKGKLTDRSGELEEKLVDVLCAVQITRSAMEIATGLSPSRAIVVISEDIDLTPAYEMARSLGVPVYAAANETVYTRPGDWLILGDSSLMSMCGRPKGDVGWQRKTTVAKQLMTGDVSRKYELQYIDSKTRDFVFRHRTGVVGLLPRNEVSRRLNFGESLELYPVDLLDGPNQNRESPRFDFPVASPFRRARST